MKLSNIPQGGKEVRDENARLYRKATLHWSLSGLP